MYNNPYMMQPINKYPNMDMQQYQPIQQPQYVPPAQPQMTKPIGLLGKPVDNVDVVRTLDIPLDGSISYFPLMDGTAIVTKKLQSDGTSKVTVYKPVDVEENKIAYLTKADLDKAMDEIDLSKYDDLFDELKEIKRDIKDLKSKK